jgi:sugar phosphate isomerase/epimerase
VNVVFSVFTKPWRLDLPALAELVAGLGFGAVELPVRPGYPVHPGNAAAALPEAARILGAAGVRIASVAGPADRATAEACAAAGVPLIRVCLGIPAGMGYLEREAEVRRELEALAPALRATGVCLGIQNHCGRDFGSALAVRRLVEAFDPAEVGAVWDPAHCALAGEPPDLAADILWSHLRLVNLKNAYWRRTSPPDAPVAEYRWHWCPGNLGLCSWPRVADELRRRGYAGDVCLTAEYSDPEPAEALVARDLAFARTLLG